MDKKIIILGVFFGLQTIQSNPLLFVAARGAGHMAMRSSFGATAGRAIVKRLSATGPRLSFGQKAQVYAKTAQAKGRAFMQNMAARAQASQQKIITAQAGAKTRSKKILLAAGGAIARNPHAALGSATGATFGYVVTDGGRERTVVEVQDAKGNVTGTRTDYARTWDGTKRTVKAMAIGAFGGGLLARNTAMIKSIKNDTAWLVKNVATKADLAQAVEKGGAYMRALYRRLLRAGNKNQSITNNQFKGVHSKLDELLAGQKSGFDKVSDLWRKWFSRK